MTVESVAFSRSSLSVTFRIDGHQIWTPNSVPRIDRFVPEFFDEKQRCFFRDAIRSWRPSPETLASIAKATVKGCFLKTVTLR
jgi:hypothetical protein